MGKYEHSYHFGVEDRKKEKKIKKEKNKCNAWRDKKMNIITRFFFSLVRNNLVIS